jgi:signal transduction histidine kinase
MKHTILVVDDTPFYVQTLMLYLTAAHFEVLVAEDGASALEQLNHVKPDLILLDVMMPGIEGFETCQMIKQNPETRDIPILFTTAVGDAVSKVKGFEAGAVDYITKPYQLAEVLARVRTHLTIVRQKRELEAALAQRNKFMSIAAHDLRNPLLAIMTWAEMGRADATAANLAELGEMFSHIRTAGTRMRDLINDFLSLQVLQDQAGERRCMKFDLNRIIEQVLDQNSFSANAKSITITKNLQSDLPMARGDAAFSHQIVANYVTNAIKYSPFQTEIQIASCVRDHAIRLEVKDQGPGIPPADRHKLFVEFAKIPTEPTGGETSTGLGLSIVKHLAENQDGKVGADFPNEGGSVFWFELLNGKKV